MSTQPLFTAEIESETLVVVPVGSVSSLAGESVKPEVDQLLKQLEDAKLRNVIIDLAEVSYFGTIMLGAMHMIWKNVRQAGGKMVVCNVSVVGREVLRIAGFDTLWTICSSREEAIDAVSN